MLHQSLETPITTRASVTAEQFALEQPHAEQQKQIRLNTLAVWAVRDYLELMNIETDLEASDSWNPVMRLCEDVADLMVPGLGKLECRPLLLDAENKSVCYLPPEVCSERIGYIVVEIDKSRKRATLLGFSPTAKDSQLLLNELQPLTDLLKHLETLSQPQIQLGQWFDNIFPTAWQEIERIFPQSGSTTDLELEGRTPNLPGWLDRIAERGKQIWSGLSGEESMELQSAGAFRSLTKVSNLLPECELMRAKLIDLGVQLGSQTVVLLLAVTKESDETHSLQSKQSSYGTLARSAVRRKAQDKGDSVRRMYAHQDSDRKLRLVVQMHPVGEEEYLPANLQLALLDESGEMLQSVTARTQDRGMQLKPFKIIQNTNFQLQMTLDDLSLTETFSF